MFKFFNKKKNKEILSTVDYNVFFDKNIVEGLPVEIINIGLLKIPSGKIIACDPLAAPDTPPYNKVVTPGQYPVKVYAVKTIKSGYRNAIAKLEFSSKKASKWILAVHDGDNINELNDNDFFGFAVDAGVGGFFDFETGIAYNKFLDNHYKENPDGNIFLDFFENEFNKNLTDINKPINNEYWINVNIPNTNLNLTMFQSGYGDGVYPAYWGVTDDNEIVSLVIDFLILFLPEE